MKVTPYAGKPAKASMLVNVRRLVTADYTEPPDYLSIRGSGSVNDVSRLHGKVSQHLFLPLFPLWQR